MKWGHNEKVFKLKKEINVMTNGFGMNPIKKAFGIYKDNYNYAIFMTQTNSFSGKIVDIDNEFVTLNPYTGYNYDKEKGPIRAFINMPSKIRLIDIVAVEPTTKKDLENYCEYSNKHQDFLMKEMNKGKSKE